MKQKLTLIAGLGFLLLANDEVPQKIRITKTEHAELPANGTVRLKNSTGELTIQGWDQPGIEIATTKSTRLAYPSAGVEREKASQMLDAVKVMVARQGDELVITTDFPHHQRFLPRPSVGARDFDLDYLIEVPRGVKLIVDHDSGEIHFDNVTGDIHATLIQGAITLRLPPNGEYAIDAKSKVGSVTSDFPGTTTRHFLGHSFVQTSQAPHSLSLRNGFGDIIILKMNGPIGL